MYRKFCFKSFDDKQTQAKVNYLLGEIALFDANFIEARNYAINAQVIKSFD